jgi:2-oxoisovalerate dehydrogenase E1 component
VKKTNRLVIAHEACKRGGLGAEIAATVMEKAFDYLDAPVARVGAPDAPMPFNHLLEQRIIPSQQDIVQAILQVCYRN